MKFPLHTQDDNIAYSAIRNCICQSKTCVCGACTTKNKLQAENISLYFIVCIHNDNNFK